MASPGSTAETASVLGKNQAILLPLLLLTFLFFGSLSILLGSLSNMEVECFNSLPSQLFWIGYSEYRCVLKLDIFKGGIKH